MNRETERTRGLIMEWHLGAFKVQKICAFHVRNRCLYDCASFFSANLWHHGYWLPKTADGCLFCVSFSDRLNIHLHLSSFICHVHTVKPCTITTPSIRCKHGLFSVSYSLPISICILILSQDWNGRHVWLSFITQYRLDNKGYDCSDCSGVLQLSRWNLQYKTFPSNFVASRLFYPRCKLKHALALSLPLLHPNAHYPLLCHYHHWFPCSVLYTIENIPS